MVAFNPSTDRRIILPTGEKAEFSDPITIYEVIVHLTWDAQCYSTFFQTFGDGLDSPGDSISSSDIEQAAISFVQKYLGIDEVAYTSSYRMGKMTYAYVHQLNV